MSSVVAIIVALIGAVGTVVAACISKGNKGIDKEIILNNSVKKVEGNDSPDKRVKSSDLVMINKGKKIWANKVENSDHIIVLKGSYFFDDEKDYLSSGLKKQRDELKEKRIIINNVFQKDFEFPNKSNAAAVINGYNTNGKTAFKENNN